MAVGVSFNSFIFLKIMESLNLHTEQKQYYRLKLKMLKDLNSESSLFKKNSKIYQKKKFKCFAKQMEITKILYIILS